ncbi:MAG: hypothetical protein DI539_18255 [Flavobacterium psychrophilum]|nr:MAG: hypothetical protein DI539_18255 [Flavobacterium psychrophilum]
MEQNSSFESFELQFTQQAQEYYHQTAKWATFLSIIGFIGSGLMVIVALAMFAIGSSMASTMGNNPMAEVFSGGMLGGFYLLFAVINFFPALYMFKFASKAKAALSEHNTVTLTESFENLKSYYKFTGIAVIIIITLYILLFFGVIVAGVSSAL